jgi:hypothetical protein
MDRVFTCRERLQTIRLPPRRPRGR